MATFHSLLQMIDTLHTEEDCRVYLENVRWNGEPVCPHCGSISAEHYKLTQNGEFKGLYKCKDCRKRFTVRQGTMFEGSNLPKKKWFYAIYLFLSHKKGISSCQLARDIDVTQKTAWFMLHRIRHNVKDDDAHFDDMTQMDETYMGGKTRHHGKGTQGRSLKDKTPIFGMVSDGLVYAQAVPNVQRKTLFPIIEEKVRKGSTVITDELNVYDALDGSYDHKKDSLRQARLCAGRVPHQLDRGLLEPDKTGYKRHLPSCEPEAPTEILQGIRIPLQHENANGH